jgi:hypothetical protein
MKMSRAQAQAERAGRQRHLAPWECSGMAVEGEAEIPPAAVGGTIRAGDLWLGLAHASLEPGRDGRDGGRYFWEVTGTGTAQCPVNLSLFGSGSCVRVARFRMHKKRQEGDVKTSIFGRSHRLDCLHGSGAD